MTIDKQHMQSVGWNLIPEKSDKGDWLLAHLLQKVDEEMVWLYDCQSFLFAFFQVRVTNSTR